MFGSLAIALARYVVVITLACGVAAPALANNGLNLIGFGTESIGMGGADIAVARDTTALNTNPAGLTRLKRPALDQYGALAYALDVAHADRFDNDAHVSNNVITLAGGGFAAPLGQSAFTAGLGFFAQGGAGSVFKNLNTAFGTREEVSALFGIAKLAPGLAWQATERLSLAIAGSVLNARAKQRFFADTSVLTPAGPFFGTTTSGLEATRTGAKLGFQYRLAPTLTLAGVYTTQTKLPLEHGHLSANMRAIGLGDVRYSDVRIDGLALPREAQLGAAWQALPATLISFQVSWLNWSRALRSQTLTATNPDNAAAPPVLSNTAALNWRNQYVYAVGIAQDLTPRTTAYAGFNYGRNPIPNDTLSPLLAAIAERTVTTGLAHRLSADWRVAAALEYVLPKKVRYNNPQLPFGADAEERTHYVALHLMLSKRW